MEKTCVLFNKKYKCVSFKVHYKGLTLITLTINHAYFILNTHVYIVLENVLFSLLYVTLKTN